MSGEHPGKLDCETSPGVAADAMPPEHATEPALQLVGPRTPGQLVHSPIRHDRQAAALQERLARMEGKIDRLLAVSPSVELRIDRLETLLAVSPSVDDVLSEMLARKKEPSTPKADAGSLHTTSLARIGIVPFPFRPGQWGRS